MSLGRFLVILLTIYNHCFKKHCLLHIFTQCLARSNLLTLWETVISLLFGLRLPPQFCHLLHLHMLSCAVPALPAGQRSWCCNWLPTDLEVQDCPKARDPEAVQACAPFQRMRIGMVSLDWARAVSLASQRDVFATSKFYLSVARWHRGRVGTWAWSRLSIHRTKSCSPAVSCPLQVLPRTPLRPSAPSEL